MLRYNKSIGNNKMFSSVVLFATAHSTLFDYFPYFQLTVESKSIDQK